MTKGKTNWIRLGIRRRIVSYRLRILAWCIWIVCVAANCLAQESAEIRTADVRIELHAGVHAPQLLSLIGATGRDGRVWRNSGDDVLPAAVEVDGVKTAVTWRLQPDLGSADARHMAFVYESTEPRMRLSWEWRVSSLVGERGLN
jgi:hypothetical protein